MYQTTSIGSQSDACFCMAPLHAWTAHCIDSADEELLRRCAAIHLLLYYAWRDSPRLTFFATLRSLGLHTALENDLRAYLHTRGALHGGLRAPATPIGEQKDDPFDNVAAQAMDERRKGPQSPFQRAWRCYCHGVYGTMFETIREWASDQMDDDLAEARQQLLALVQRHVPVNDPHTIAFEWLCLLWLAYVIEYAQGRLMDETLALQLADNEPARPFSLSSMRALAHEHVSPERANDLAPWVRVLEQFEHETVEYVH